MIFAIVIIDRLCVERSHYMLFDNVLAQVGGCGDGGGGGGYSGGGGGGGCRDGVGQRPIRHFWK